MRWRILLRSQSTALVWKFSYVDTSFDVSGCRERSSANVNPYQKIIVEQIPRQVVRNASHHGCQHFNIIKLPQKIGNKERLDQCVPHEFSENQIFRRFEFCWTMHQRNLNNPFLDRILFWGEKYILCGKHKRLP